MMMTFADASPSFLPSSCHRDTTSERVVVRVFLASVSLYGYGSAGSAAYIVFMAKWPRANESRAVRDVPNT